MLIVSNILLPVFLIIGLGALLARKNFLTPELLSGLNNLAYFIGLPALVIDSVADARIASRPALLVAAAFMTATCLTLVAGWLVSILIRLPAPSRPTFVSACYRGNLAYLSLPLVVYSSRTLDPSAESYAASLVILSLLPATFFYNLSAAIILELGRHEAIGRDLGTVLRSLLRNPIVLACVLAILLVAADWRLPVFLQRGMEALGQIALPAALLTIGGQLITTPPGREFGHSLSLSLVKLGLCPLIGFAIAPLFGLGSTELRVYMLMLASPVAVAAYIMTRKLQGDARLAGSAIISSTLLAFFSFGLVLYLF